MHIWKKHKICRKNTSVQCRVHRLLPIKYHTKHYVLLTDTLSPARFGWVWRTVASDSFSWRERNPIWSSAVVACLPRDLMCCYTVNSFPTKILRRNTRLPFLLILHFAESSLALGFGLTALNYRTLYTGVCLSKSYPNHFNLPQIDSSQVLETSR